MQDETQEDTVAALIYYVYLLRSVTFPSQTYIGYTQNLKERLDKHNAGGSVYSAKYKPWELMACFFFHEKLQATEFEKYWKSGSGRTFVNKRLLKF